MKLWWRKPESPAIPPYRPPIQQEQAAKPEPGLVVEEVDTSQMSRTAIFRAWDRMTGKFKEPKP